MIFNRENVQLMIVILCLIAGVTLLFMGFWVTPTGVIDNSILIAFGEVATFVGSVLGVDYKYRFKIKE